MFPKLRNYLLKKMCELEPDITEEKRAELEYGLHLFISEVFKLSVLFISSIIFGVVVYFLIISAVLWILRLHLGGIHAKSHLMCLLSSFAIVYLLMAAACVSPIPYIYSEIVAIPLTFFIAFKYAPADLPEKPITSIKQRKKLKTYGLISLAILYSICFLAPHTWANMIIYSSLVQSLLMTPVIYKITKNNYGYERRREVYGKNI